MKEQLNYLVRALMIGLVMLACTSKKNENASTSPDPDAWPEMESFHMVMAEAYHPFMDSKNLEPIKSLAENLSRESEKWAAAALPERMNNDDIKAKLSNLKTDSRRLADLVKSRANDDEIGKALAALHESFHEIMEAWHGGHEEKHEHH